MNLLALPADGWVGRVLDDRLPRDHHVRCCPRSQSRPLQAQQVQAQQDFLTKN